MRVGGSPWFCRIACEEVMRLTAFFPMYWLSCFMKYATRGEGGGIGQLFLFLMIRRIICSFADLQVFKKSMHYKYSSFRRGMPFLSDVEFFPL